jgi:hypothetical protein
MRRLTITLSAAVLLIVVAPAGALARHRGHSARHHNRHHHARVRHARLERFGDQTGGTLSSSSANNAGAVKSFQNGVLTIALPDGTTTVSGKVNRDTEVECMAPQAMHTEGDTGGGDGSGDQSTSGDQTSGEDPGEATEPNETQVEDQNETQAEDQNEGAEDQNEAAEENENEADQSCSSANLTPGTTVREAELSVSSAGSVWKKVELGS